MTLMKYLVLCGVVPALIQSFQRHAPLPRGGTYSPQTSIARLHMTTDDSSSSLPMEVLVATALGGSLAGLVAGGLLDGIVAHGDAPYSAPLAALILGNPHFFLPDEGTRWY